MTKGLLQRLDWVATTTGIRRGSLAVLITDADEYQPGKIRARKIGRQRRYVAMDVLKLCGKDEPSQPEATQ